MIRPQVELVATGEFDALIAKVDEIALVLSGLAAVANSPPGTGVEAFGVRLRKILDMADVYEHEVTALMQAWKAHESAVLKVEQNISHAHKRIDACAAGLKKLQARKKPRGKAQVRKKPRRKV